MGKEEVLMTRQEARERLEGTFLFQLQGGKVVLRDVALIEAVKAYEEEVQQQNRARELISQTHRIPAALAL
jgi:hypothetical protein